MNEFQLNFFLQSKALIKNIDNNNITLTLYIYRGSPYHAGIICISKFIGEKCVKQKEVTLDEFDTAIRNGGYFGFERKEIYDFLEKNSDTLNEIRNENRKYEQPKILSDFHSNCYTMEY